MKKLLFLFTALAIGLTSFAQIKSTASGGNWSENSTWEGGTTPTITDDVIIVTKSIVYVDVDAFAKDITVNGDLIINPGITLNTVPPPPPIAIGDFYEGGVVFYLDGSGGGFVCAVSDQYYQGDYTVEWGCQGTAINGADGTAIGTGAANTAAIEAGCQTAGIAADICANLSLNGYDDWFLPSRDELNEMYLNKAAIDATAKANGGQAFPNAYYWISSEYSSTNAGLQGFYKGVQTYGGKTLTYRVRAVRAF